jgi:hypothetical protein
MMEAVRERDVLTAQFANVQKPKNGAITHNSKLSQTKYNHDAMRCKHTHTTTQNEHPSPILSPVSSVVVGCFFQSLPTHFTAKKQRLGPMHQRTPQIYTFTDQEVASNSVERGSDPSDSETLIIRLLAAQITPPL